MAENENTRLNLGFPPESRRSPFKEISKGGCKENTFLSSVPSNLTFEGLARRNKENSPPVQIVQQPSGVKTSSIVETESTSKTAEPARAMTGRTKSIFFYDLFVDLLS